MPVPMPSNAESRDIGQQWLYIILELDTRLKRFHLVAIHSF